MEGALYALGGTDGCSSLNSVEKFEPDAVFAKWTSATPMTMQRIAFGAAVLKFVSVNCASVSDIQLAPVRECQS